MALIAPELPDVKPIPQKLDILGDRLSELENLTQALCNRLTPVLLMPPSDPSAKSVAQPVPTQAPMVEHLSEFEYRLQGVTSHIYAMLDGLQL